MTNRIKPGAKGNPFSTSSTSLSDGVTNETPSTQEESSLGSKPGTRVSTEMPSGYRARIPPPGRFDEAYADLLSRSPEQDTRKVKGKQAETPVAVETTPIAQNTSSASDSLPETWLTYGRLRDLQIAVKDISKQLGLRSGLLPPRGVVNKDVTATQILQQLGGVMNVPASGEAKTKPSSSKDASRAFTEFELNTLTTFIQALPRFHSSKNLSDDVQAAGISIARVLCASRKVNNDEANLLLKATALTIRGPSEQEGVSVSNAQHRRKFGKELVQSTKKHLPVMHRTKKDWAWNAGTLGLRMVAYGAASLLLAAGEATERSFRKAKNLSKALSFLTERVHAVETQTVSVDVQKIVADVLSRTDNIDRTNTHRSDLYHAMLRHMKPEERAEFDQVVPDAGQLAAKKPAQLHILARHNASEKGLAPGTPAAGPSSQEDPQADQAQV